VTRPNFCGVRSRRQHRLPAAGPKIVSSFIEPSSSPIGPRPGRIYRLGPVDGDSCQIVKRTVSLCFSTLRQLCSIRRQVPTDVFQSLVVALVLSRLDYCNGVLIGLPANLIRRLQSVQNQNAAARLIFGIRRSEHITDALASLHWLRVPALLLKVAVLTYRTLNGNVSAYLLSYFTRAASVPSRSRLLSSTVYIQLYPKQ